jgi:hypothetical protein
MANRLMVKKEYWYLTVNPHTRSIYTYGMESGLEIVELRITSRRSR